MSGAYSPASLAWHYTACVLETAVPRRTEHARNVQFNEPGYESASNHNKTAVALGVTGVKDDTQKGGGWRIEFATKLTREG